MFCRSEAERLGLRVVVGVQAGLNLPVADDDDGQYDAEKQCANGNNAREADRLEHDIPEAGDLIALHDSYDDRSAWRLHRPIVPQP